MSNDKASAAAWASEIDSFRKTKNTVDESIAGSAPRRLQPALNSHMGRDYDIVSFTAKNTSNVVPESNKAKRALSAAQIAGQSPEHVQRGVDRALKRSHHGFDCVTHKPVYGLSEQAAQQQFPPERHRGVRAVGDHHGGRRNFDLVSNTALHGREADFEREQKAMNHHVPRYAPRERQTDIVTHRFKINHESREWAQKQELKRKLDARLKPTDFNPVVGQWRDRDVEEGQRAEAQRKESELRDSVKNHTFKVSELVRRSEGHAADALTGQVHNPEFLLEIERRQARGRMQRTRARQEYEHRRDLEEAVREVDAQLVLQRHHPSKRPEFAGGLPPPSTLARLEAAMASKPAKPSDVYLAEGPRTTHERVLCVKPSEIAAAANTYEGRKKLILPTLEKAAGKPMRREELISVLRKEEK